MPQIDRTGVIRFHDAEISIQEAGLTSRMSWPEREAWRRSFKHDVFARIVQTLRRIGWTVGPQTYIFTNEDNRYCEKGAIKGDLQLSGRSITFKMFQSVNCPTRPDHGGRYEWNKEAVMPYPLRLEMERTRRRIRDYLVNVMAGYRFEPPRLRSNAGMAFILQARDELNRFHGGKFYDSPPEPYNSKSVSGGTIAHGDPVYFRENGRLQAGTAFHNINNMWWVLCPGGVVRNVASFKLFHREDLPARLPAGRWFSPQERQKRIELAKQQAMRAEDFERAAAARNALQRLIEFSTGLVVQESAPEQSETSERPRQRA